MTSGFLERHFDPNLRLPRNSSRETLEEQEIERLVRALALTFVAGSITRRLGYEASREELALDKKRARRVSHALRQSLISWIRKPPPIEVDDKIRREGAQLDWTLFVEAHVSQLSARMRIDATWAIKNDEQRWGRSAIVNLENELHWITYAMRDWAD